MVHQQLWYFNDLSCGAHTTFPKPLAESKINLRGIPPNAYGIEDKPVRQYDKLRKALKKSQAE